MNWPPSPRAEGDLRDFQPVPLVSAEKAKVLQILVNLVRNAKYACDDGPNPGPTRQSPCHLALAPGRPGGRLVVADNGVGIPGRQLTRIFNHGFTRATGHGFGLHSSANAAKEMKRPSRSIATARAPG